MLNKYQLRVTNYLIKRGFRIMHARPVTSNFSPYGTSLVNRMAVLFKYVIIDDFGSTTFTKFTQINARIGQIKQLLRNRKIPHIERITLTKELNLLLKGTKPET